MTFITPQFSQFGFNQTLRYIKKSKLTRKEGKREGEGKVVYIDIKRNSDCNYTIIYISCELCKK